MKNIALSLTCAVSLVSLGNSTKGSLCKILKGGLVILRKDIRQNVPFNGNRLDDASRLAVRAQYRDGIKYLSTGLKDYALIMKNVPNPDLYTLKEIMNTKFLAHSCDKITEKMDREENVGEEDIQEIATNIDKFLGDKFVENEDINENSLVMSIGENAEDEKNKNSRTYSVFHSWFMGWVGFGLGMGIWNYSQRH